MADNDISNALKDIGYSISRGLAAFGSGQTGFDFEKGFRERDAAMAKAAEDAKGGGGVYIDAQGKVTRIPGNNITPQPQTPGNITGTTPGVVTPGKRPAIDINELMRAEAQGVPMDRLKPVTTPGKAPLSEQSTTGIPKTDIAVTGGTVGKAPTVGQTPESKIEQSLFKEGIGKDINRNAKVKDSMMVADTNLELVSGSVHDLSEVYAEGLVMGALGNKYKAKVTELSTEGWLPWLAKGREAGGAFSGKKFETITKIFPMLTQQVGKEGSVRILSKVFDELSASFPSESTPGNVGERQMFESVRSMFRIALVTNRIDPAQYDLKTKNGETEFADKVVEIYNNVNIDDNTQSKLTKLTNTALEPLILARANKDFIKRALGTKNKETGKKYTITEAISFLKEQQNG